MKLIPIALQERDNERFINQPACVEILNIYPEYYKKIGFHKPWIGYFASLDGEHMIGAAGFKGKPKDGKVEIAYATFKEHEGKGVGTEICKQLVMLALRTDKNVRVTARTLQDGHASIAILKKNGFESKGIVRDEDDGDVLEWELPKERAKQYIL